MRTFSSSTLYVLFIRISTLPLVYNPRLYLNKSWDIIIRYGSMSWDEMPANPFTQQMHLDGSDTYSATWRAILILSMFVTGCDNATTPCLVTCSTLRERKQMPKDPKSGQEPTIIRNSRVESYVGLRDSLKKTWTEKELRKLRRQTPQLSFMIHSKHRLSFDIYCEINCSTRGI